MPKKLTQKEFEERVYNCVGDKYTVISEYKGKTKPITLYCNIHKIEFTVSAECFMRGQKDIRGNCPKCQEEAREERFKDQRIEVKCAYCGKKIIRPLNKVQNSKSGLFFCCKQHKDLAACLEYGLEAVWPEHYNRMTKVGATKNTYRQAAFRNKENCCANCGWNEDIDVLEVHHIDENRENNTLENLLILCPNCHRKLTTHKYIWDGSKIVYIKT